VATKIDRADQNDIISEELSPKGRSGQCCRDSAQT
jgi:hypothetical protein